MLIVGLDAPHFCQKRDELPVTAQRNARLLADDTIVQRARKCEHIANGPSVHGDVFHVCRFQQLAVCERLRRAPRVTQAVQRRHLLAQQRIELLLCLVAGRQNVHPLRHAEAGLRDREFVQDRAQNLQNILLRQLQAVDRQAGGIVLLL